MRCLASAICRRQAATHAPLPSAGRGAPWPLGLVAAVAAAAGLAAAAVVEVPALAGEAAAVVLVVAAVGHETPRAQRSGGGS